MSRDPRGLGMASAASQARPEHRQVAGHSFFRDLLARSSLAQQRAAQQQPQARRELPKLNAALCLHGTRTWLLPRTADKLLRELAQPLNADIYAFVPVAHGSNSTFDASELRSLRALNATGRLIAAVKRADPSSTPRVNGSVILPDALVRDHGNVAACFHDVLLPAARRLGRSYQLWLHCRLDFLLWDPVPASLLFQLAGPRAATNDTIWVPQGDDFDGIVDWLAIGSPNAMETYMGATEWWAAGALAVRPRLTNYSFSFPEQVRHRYLLHRGVEVRRFELPACRIDHRGFCRYPGEVAALVYATPPRPSLGCGDSGAVCGAVWSTKFAEPDDEICWRTKGWYACEIDWNDPGCCRLKQACMEWRRRCTTQAAPKGKAAPAGRARGLPGRGMRR